jgi:hypothetical protein
MEISIKIKIEKKKYFVTISTYSYNTKEKNEKSEEIQ